MHIPNYSQIVSPLYQVTWKKNSFEWGPEQRQAFEQIKRDTPLYNKLPEDKKQYALFTDGSCRIVGKQRRWKAAVWSPT